MRRLNAITFLNNFAAGALTLIIPLLLLTQNLDLAEIGVVLSVLPLVFLVARLLLAAVADQVGWSSIFLLVNWPATVFSTVVYYVASSLSVFFVGKIAEGLRDASYWAVNRGAIYDLSPKNAEKEATRNNAVIWLATAVGSAFAGLGLAFAGFSTTILLLTVASVGIGVPAGLLWKIGRKKTRISIRVLLKSLIPNGKGSRFWWASIALMFNSSAVYPLLTLLLPVFMQNQMGYDYVIIGVLFMLYNFIASAITFLTLKTTLNFKRVVFLSVVALLASLFLASSGLFFPALLFALAFVRGFSIAYFEHLVVKVARNNQNVCVNIAWLHVPMRFAEFGSVLSAGFVVEAAGYAPVFTATGVAFVAFLLIAFHELKLV
jgi:MFS family permease